MATIAAFIKRRPLLAYYALTFSISWGGMLLAIGGPSGLPGTPEQADRLMGVAFSLMAGPSVAGLLLTGLLSKGAGLRDLLARLRRWRVGARWYAVALLTSPLLAMAVFFALSWRFSEFPIVTTNDKTSLLLQAIAAGLGGGFLEELGWTGFAIPRLKQRHGVFATGIIAGLLWGAWHFLVNFWYSGTNSAELPLPLFLTLYVSIAVAQLTAYRVLMVWVYDRTESLLLAVLMHASLIISTTPILIPAMTGSVFLTWFAGLAIALWVVAAAVATRMKPNGTSHIVRSRDGTRIAYLSVGTGPSVLVVPGVLSMAADYAAFARALSEHFAVHTIERRGRGQSGPQGGDYSIVKECEDVLAVRAETGASLIVGHSYGGLVALEVARNNKAFTKVAVYEPGVSINGSMPTAWMPGYEKKLAERRRLDALVEFTLADAPPRIQKTPPWLMKLLLFLLVSCSRQYRQMLRLLRQNLSEWREIARLDNSCEHYRDIAADVLLMYGGKSDSTAVTLAMERLAAILPRSETKKFPRLDHFGIEKTAPHEVAAVVSDYFLTGGPESTPSRQP